MRVQEAPRAAHARSRWSCASLPRACASARVRARARVMARVRSRVRARIRVGASLAKGWGEA